MSAPDLLFGAAVHPAANGATCDRQSAITNAEQALRRAIHHIKVAKSAERGFVAELSRAWADLKEHCDV